MSMTSSEQYSIIPLQEDVWIALLGTVTPRIFTRNRTAVSAPVFSGHYFNSLEAAQIGIPICPARGLPRLQSLLI
jgi:hypothetical protein